MDSVQGMSLFSGRAMVSRQRWKNHPRIIFCSSSAPSVDNFALAAISSCRIGLWWSTGLATVWMARRGHVPFDRCCLYLVSQLSIQWCHQCRHQACPKGPLENQLSGCVQFRIGYHHQEFALLECLSEQPADEGSSYCQVIGHWQGCKYFWKLVPIRMGLVSHRR